MKLLLKSGATVLLLAALAALAFYLRPLPILDAQTHLRLTLAGVRSRTIQVEANQIHFYEAGAGAHPLVMIHGLSGRGEDFAVLIAGLAAQGFHVYVPDLPGYGRSSQPADADYSIAYEAHAMAAFLHALNLTHADVAGESMGGWVALTLALDHPDLADRLVLYDSAGIYFVPTWSPSLFSPKTMPDLIQLRSMLTPDRRPIPPFIGAQAIAGLKQNAWVIQRSLHSMTAGRDLLDFRLGQLTKPTLIVWGKQDELIPLAVGQTLHRYIANSSLMVVDGCGHLEARECSHPVLKKTIEFLKADPPMASQETEVPGH